VQVVGVTLGSAASPIEALLRVRGGLRRTGRAGRSILVEVVLDRHTEGSELGHVVESAARGSELEVEQRHGDPVTEDDVRELHIVMAHQHPARRVSQTVVPAETLRVEPECGLEGRSTCAPTRTTWPAFAIPPSSCCSDTPPP
jgi:hypothetical protein